MSHKKLNVSYNTVHKRTDNIMSSLSPNNEDARRKSPRKSAGQMPQYLARDYTNTRGGKEGRSREVVGQNRQEREMEKWERRRSLSPIHQASPCQMIIVIPVLQYQGRSQGGLQVVVVGRNGQKRVSPRWTMIAIRMFNQGVER